MSDNKQKITGYRELTEQQIELINVIKAAGNQIGDLVAAVQSMEDIDQRWAATAKTNLQIGFMTLIRSIAQPESF